MGFLQAGRKFTKSGKEMEGYCFEPSTATTAAATSTIDGVAMADEGISAVNCDIIKSHILTRLDGSTLASIRCCSSQFQTLASEETLWSNICRSTWPSTDTPRLGRLISSLPSGSRTFFSDSYPLITTTTAGCYLPKISYCPSELISAIDVHYGEKLVLCKVIEIETESRWFQCSPFRVDLLNPKDAVETPIQYQDGEDMCQELSRRLTLSWIVIDPIRRRAMNVSSYKPVCVQRHWLSGEIQVRFASILAGEKGTSTELVQCGIVVTSGGSIGGEIQVREVSLEVEDMDGVHLNGRESLVIMERAMMEGKRGRGRREGEGKRCYEKYIEKKRERKERMVRTEGRLDMVCVAIVGFIFAGCWFLLLC